MLDVTDIMGFGLSFDVDDKGRTIAVCKRGFVYVAEDGDGEHFVAVLRKGTHKQAWRLIKLGLPKLWATDDEYAVRCGPEKQLHKILNILQPKNCAARRPRR